MTGISTSAFYDRAGIDMGALRAQAERLQTSIGSGQRLTSSADDPSAAARLRTMTRADTFSAVDAANAGRASDDLSLADSSLSEITNSIARAIELATQAANGTLSADQRNSIGAELGQIRQGLVALANGRDSAGHALFGGETAGAAYTLDASGNPVYAGTTGSGTLSLGDGQSVTRGLTGPEFLNFTVNGTPTDIFSVIGTLSAALQGGSADPAGAARTALDGLNAGMDSATVAQTVVGTRLSWIDQVGERRQNLQEQRSANESSLGGTDLAGTVAQLQQTMTVLEASQASFARLSSLSLFDMIR